MKNKIEHVFADYITVKELKVIKEIIIKLNLLQYEELQGVLDYIHENVEEEE